MEHGHAASRLCAEQAHRLLPRRGVSERARRACGFRALACHDQHAGAVVDEHAGRGHDWTAPRVLALLDPALKDSSPPALVFVFISKATNTIHRASALGGN